jgi:hypothetical protein
VDGAGGRGAGGGQEGMELLVSRLEDMNLGTHELTPSEELVTEVEQVRLPSATPNPPISLNPPHAPSSCASCRRSLSMAFLAELVARRCSNIQGHQRGAASRQQWHCRHGWLAGACVWGAQSGCLQARARHASRWHPVRLSAV